MIKNPEIKIAVVIPCFNASKTIEKCIDSILNQTHKADEIILVDDCSTDDTWQIIKSIQAEKSKFINIKLASSGKNSGPSVARNTGIKMANSNWIALLDSDDYWDDTKLEKQIAIYQTNKDVKLISCAYKKKKLPESIGSKVISFRRSCLVNYFETPTVLAEKKVLEEFPFNEHQKYAEDHIVWMKIIKNHKAICLNEVLAYCVLDKNPYGDSGLSANLWEMEKGELKNFKVLLKDGDISLPEFVVFSSFSLMKFVRRILIVTSRNIFNVKN